MMQFGFIYLSRGRCYFVFPTFLAITPSLVLLHGNVHNFACNILILRDNFGIIFYGIARYEVLQLQVFQNFQDSIVTASTE